MTIEQNQIFTNYYKDLITQGNAIDMLVDSIQDTHPHFTNFILNNVDNDGALMDLLEELIV